MTSDHAEFASEQSPADEVSTEELARQQGVRPVESVDDMARPDLFDSDEEWEEFLGNLYPSRHSCRLR
jgi:hypothetical protein